MPNGIRYEKNVRFNTIYCLLLFQEVLFFLLFSIIYFFKVKCMWFILSFSFVFRSNWHQVYVCVCSKMKKSSSVIIKEMWLLYQNWRNGMVGGGCILYVNVVTSLFNFFVSFKMSHKMKVVIFFLYRCNVFANFFYLFSFFSEERREKTKFACL